METSQPTPTCDNLPSVADLFNPELYTRLQGEDLEVGSTFVITRYTQKYWDEKGPVFHWDNERPSHRPRLEPRFNLDHYTDPQCAIVLGKGEWYIQYKIIKPDGSLSDQITQTFGERLLCFQEKKTTYSARKNYLELAEGVQYDPEHPYPDPQSKYLFNEDTMKEISSYRGDRGGKKSKSKSKRKSKRNRSKKGRSKKNKGKNGRLK
jgi:hypothetical protein